MKKFFTLAAVALTACALTATAQDRSWDFTNWSEGTKQDLHTEALTVEAPTTSSSHFWRAFEKIATTDQQEHLDHAYWWGDTSTGVDGDQQLYANGNLIVETAGLKWTTLKAGNLAIAVDYPETSLGTYAGPQYLWIGGSNLTFVIQDVKPGATITMEVESHKPSDGRGVAMTVDGRNVSPTQGSEKPTTKTTCVWQVPSDLTGESYDVSFTNNNGCHIYSISVTEPKAQVDGARFAYIYDSSFNPKAGTEQDNYYVELRDGGNVGFANVDVYKLDLASINGALPQDIKEELLSRNAVVLSGSITSVSWNAVALRELISYVPVINLSADIYNIWGLGTPTKFGGTITATEAYRNNSLFKPRYQGADIDSYLDADGQLILGEGQLTGVKLAADGIFAADNIIATGGNDVVAIHRHNQSRNSYIFLPFDFNASYAEEDAFYDIYIGAIMSVMATKGEAPAVATPVIEKIYKNMATDIKISTSTKGSTIYYTTDGTDPTDQSTVYTGIISGLAEGTVVKAIAYNLDGYVPSAVAEATIDVVEACLPPVVALNKEQGKTTVTLTAAEAGTKVYYNLDGTQELNRSSLYDESSVVSFTHPITLYAFATLEDESKKPSEVIAIDVEVNGVARRDNVLSHFDANKNEYSFGESKVHYFTDGKKNGYNYFIITDSVRVDTTMTVTISDPDTGEEYTETRDTTFWNYITEPANRLTSYNPGSGWEIKTYGQGMLWEVTAMTYDLTVDGAYRAETALDYGASDCFIQFGNVQKSDGKHNDPYSGMVQSTQAFQGPFDITCFIGSGSSGNHPRGVLYVSKDTLDEANWTPVDTVWAAPTNRWVRKTVLSYNGTEKMFVRLQAAFSSYCVRDIIITNNPDESANGIRDVLTDEQRGQVVRREVFAIDGKRMSSARRGVNIIRFTYENGQTETRKVVVR